MRITKSELECVAVKPSQYPPMDLPEIAFVGRSNVGKSSLLNYLTGRKSLARVSGSPGKTRTINFYRINDSFRIVDLPGYGYAKVSREITKDWDKMMADFFETRENLKRVVQLVDIRHDPTAQDAEMYDFLREYGLSGIICATKADKVSGNQKQNSISAIKKKLKLTSNDIIIPISAMKRTGGEELLTVIERELDHVIE
ncbi:MAG: YihA family ribosome biogenesis GTP-binding protein [Firmicutes bacterium]|nr:YihA family ribosome biogenesis GTP-binding protein [Bacillota bacterium]